MNLIDKFRSKVRIKDHHWIWLGRVPQFWTGERVVLAARWIFEYYRGPITTQLRNTCGQLGCVSPEHHERVEDVFWLRLATRENDCREWTGPTTDNGYGFSGRKSERLAHRYAWTLEHGPIPDGMYVLHRCDNRLCCNPEHLFLGSAADNMRDMHAKGRANPPRGIRNAASKMSDETAAELHRRAAAGEGVPRLAREYGISKVTAYLILSGENWRHLDLPPLKLQARGERHGRSKLTDDLVREIRAARAAGETFKAIADRVGLSVGAVHNVVSRKTWGHIE